MIKYYPYKSDKPNKKYYIITNNNKKVYFGASHGPQPARENDRERFDYRGSIESSRGPSAGPRFKEIAVV